MKHIFDVDVATEYGINAAILFENICYWIKQNEANEINFFDGDYWTYNSKKAFAELFPYMSERQVRTALDKLIESDLIKTGNYNKLAYDRTLWYALTQKGKCIGLFDIMEHAKKPNGNSREVQPIPNINTGINPNNKQLINKERKNNSFDEIINCYLYPDGKSARFNDATERKELLQEWLKVRKAKRAAMTDRAIQMNIDKLDELARKSGMSVTDYLSEVIRRGWAAFFEIKEYGNKNQTMDKPETSNPFLQFAMEEGELF